MTLHGQFLHSRRVNGLELLNTLLGPSQESITFLNEAEKVLLCKYLEAL